MERVLSDLELEESILENLVLKRRVPKQYKELVRECISCPTIQNAYRTITDEGNFTKATELHKFTGVEPEEDVRNIPKAYTPIEKIALRMDCIRDPEELIDSDNINDIYAYFKFYDTERIDRTLSRIEPIYVMQPYAVCTSTSKELFAAVIIDRNTEFEQDLSYQARLTVYRNLNIMGNLIGKPFIPNNYSLMRKKIWRNQDFQ